jgi:hypothetical protein
VARAKRTARADARRRYRAATEPEIDFDGDAEVPTERVAGQRTPLAASAATSPGRVGIVDALRVSIHPPRIREDLILLPGQVTHPSLWLPVLITIATTVAVVVSSGRDLVTPILFAYFVQTPAIGGVFLAGFLAPRASWLLGAIVGLVAAIGYVAVLVLVPGALGPAAPAGTLESVAVSAIILSPILGALFASAAAWYRRFLRLSNPNRRRPPASQPKRGDGRTRGSTSSQKAGARR